MRILVAKPDLTGREAEYVLDAIQRQGNISSFGEYLDRFERLGAEYCCRKYALCTSNGTTALHLALMALGVGPGDEVIVPTFTFIATASTVVHCGATPIFVDANADDWNLDIEALDAVRTSRTKAVISADLYGVPCNKSRLSAWCKLHSIALVEDAAEAFGASWDEKPVGGFGDVSCFSFYGNKIITTGEGGMCLTDNQELYERMRVLKNHGMRAAGVYEHDVVGYNYRLTNIQAAIGCAQLERVDSLLKKRDMIRQWYHDRLCAIPGITLPKLCLEQSPVFWMMAILLDRISSARVKQILLDHDIETRPFFAPLHRQKAFSSFPQKIQAFPVAEDLFRRGIILPSSSLLTRAEVDFVCDALEQALAHS